MEEKLKKEMLILKFYSVFITLTIAVLFYLYFQQKQNSDFEEITVERLNIVEKDGSLKMVISNSARQHNGTMNGTPLPQRERPAGMIFFNSAGDECGGLIYDGTEKNAGLVLSVDKFRDDQIMQLQYMENTKADKRKYGLQLWDYPKEDTFNERYSRFDSLNKLQGKARKKALEQMKKDSLLMNNRLFVGKKYNNEVGLFINDSKGNPRIRLFIDTDNNAGLEFLDETGKVISRK